MSKNSNAFNNMKIEPIKNYIDSEIISTFSDLSFGVFVWSYKDNVCYVNEYMIERFQIDFNSIESLHDFLAIKIDDNSLFTFLERVYSMRVDEKEKRVEFPAKSRDSIRWYGVDMKYHKKSDITVGILKRLDENKLSEFKEFNTSNFYKSLLYQIGFPITLVSLSGDIQFSNFDTSEVQKNVYKIIEDVYNGGVPDFSSIEFIDKVSLLEKGLNEAMFEAKYLYRNANRDEMITRVKVTHKKENYIMYTHQRIVNSSIEQMRLRKILRANELMMEIKDIVDHVDDLNEMFNYLLSKIHTVIPEVNRCCILRLDENDALFLDSSYGFKEEYVEEFKLPFKKSFAYMHMQNDYTKSVIINDIQRKYSDLFPDIKGDDTRFRIQSNITAPLVINDQLFGIISVDSDQNGVFDDVDLTLLDFMKVQTERAVDKYRKYRDIKKDSTHDSLTGVSNRRHLLSVIQDYKERCNKLGTSFLFVVFDIDNLKKVNDTYGHNCGDLVIKQFAFTVQSSIRDSDFFARIGGDEFVGLFYDVDEQTLIQRIHTWKTYFNNNPIEYRSGLVYTKFSYGISMYPDEGTFFSELMEVSDSRMYDQKEDKRKTR